MKYITVKQFNYFKEIPRGRLAARFLCYAGAIIEKENKILLCKSAKSKYPGYQLPGGRVLWSESIIDTVNREVLEETGLSIELINIVEISQRDTGPEDEEYIRFVFSAKEIKSNENATLDTNIEVSEWFDLDRILDGTIPLQSEQIREEIRRYHNKEVYPLEILGMFKW